ncbi:MAG: AzlC family ABC transporter permease [Oscillospiraceae bacterium]|nr:AzlC family ABC transporter permease [Oscillospiraceae bacterium]
MRQELTFLKGLKDGIPICLGYLSVSFTFGMMAARGGLPLGIIQMISMTNLTSAGQFAGTALVLSGGAYLEVAVTTLVINLRYMLMSLSLSQKLEPSMPRWERALLAFGNTDEIFAVAMQQKGYINGKYLLGLIVLPYVGWAAGTLLGATAFGALPASAVSALNIAIYGMFIAIVVPPMRKLRPVLFTVCISAFISCVFRFVPGLSRLSSGWVIIICAIAASALAAVRYPVDEEAAQ